MSSRRPGVVEALVAAALFGAATPFASRLVNDASAPVLAGLLYLGSGLVLAASLVIWRPHREAPLEHHDFLALGGAIVLGGGLGPLLLVVGLERLSASGASLLLNLEVVFTALLAWMMAREGFGVRVGIGLILITAGAAAVSWQPGTDAGSSGAAHSSLIGVLAIVGACLCWGFDNNLTVHVASKDPRQIAALKGVIAGGANLAIGLSVGGALPAPSRTLAAMGIGVVGYGISLMLFVLALRSLGAARTGALFAVGPFAGVAIAIGVFHESPPRLVAPAVLLMSAGVALYLTERHQHLHAHRAVTHRHVHTHDDPHHQHAHASGVSVVAPHTHLHVHMATTHSHPHQPDTHHRHGHGHHRGQKRDAGG